MATKKRAAAAQRVAKDLPPRTTVKQVLAWLDENADPKVRAGLARYAIPTERACGVPVGTLRSYAKQVGIDHALALQLWKTERYEARIIATFVADPAQLSAAEMDAWSRDFDSWAICDTACFHLFDRSPLAWRKVDVWCKRSGELVKRAAFALVASLALHGKKAPSPLARWVRGRRMRAWRHRLRVVQRRQVQSVAGDACREMAARVGVHGPVAAAQDQRPRRA